jgi:hypothetical protein
LNRRLSGGSARGGSDAFFDFAFRDQSGFFSFHFALIALFVLVLVAFLAAFCPMTHEDELSLFEANSYQPSAITQHTTLLKADGF